MFRSHLRLCLKSGVLPFGFTTKSLHAFRLASMHVTCPLRLSLPHLITETSGDWATNNHTHYIVSSCPLLLFHRSYKYLHALQKRTRLNSAYIHRNVQGKIMESCEVFVAKSGADFSKFRYIWNPTSTKFTKVPHNSITVYAQNNLL